MKKRQDEEERKKIEAKKQAEGLMKAFKTVPKEKVQEILDKNEGDIEATTDELLFLVDQLEVQKKQQQKELERRKQEQEARAKELKITALASKFPDIPEDYVVTTLEKVGGDIKEAAAALLKYSTEQKKKELKAIFQSAMEDEIDSALEKANWDKVKAAEYLNKTREERRKSKQQESPKKEPVLKKINNTFLERSVLLVKEIENELSASRMIIAKTEEADNRAQKGVVAAIFKNQLENIIATQAREGVVPGMAPPLPRQIDALLGKTNKPVPDEVEKEEQPLQEPPERSQTEKVGEKYVVTLTATPNVVDVGNNITVNWKRSEKSLAYDWISLCLTNQPNKAYITYQWSGKELTEGSLVFVAPKVYGEYEFRYLTDNGYMAIGVSNKFLVQPQFELMANLDPVNKKIIAKWKQASGNPYSRAWIGLYQKSQSNNKQYLVWEYANKPDNTVVFDAPLKPSEYEVRFFPYSYIDVARSNPIRIEGEDRLDVNISEDGIIHVTYDVVSIDPYQDNAWLGIFFTTEKDSRQWRRYKYIKDRKAEVVFASGPRTAGEYHVRLFANKNYEPILTSKPFIVQGKK